MAASELRVEKYIVKLTETERTRRGLNCPRDPCRRKHRDNRVFVSNFLARSSRYMLRTAGTFSVLDKIAVLRLAPFPILLALSACTTAASTQPDMHFALADPAKYKTDADRERAQQFAETACKAKAMQSSTELEKTIASEHHSRENLSRAREKSAEMYSTSFALCMISNGYVKR